MSNTSKKQQRVSAEAQRAAVVARRSSARRQREERRQRRIVITAGVSVGLALLALIGGLLYDQVWLPSRPVAQVASTSLNRGQYAQERRLQLARELYGTLDLIGRFGSQFGAQFAQRIPQLNAEAAAPAIRAAPVDDATVGEWSDRQVITQAAVQQGLQVSDAEVAQALVSALNESFPPLPTAPVSGTASITPTAAVTTTGDVTATAALTPTIAPTATQQPTPGVDQAPGQVDAALTRLYEAYNAQLLDTTPNLSREDFGSALNEQFRQQVLTEKIQAGLVPEEGFTLSTDPESLTVSHILVKVELAEDASEADRTAAFAARKASAEAILAEVQGGADFATVAGDRSDDLTSRENGGQLAPFDQEGKTQDGAQIDPAFVQAALALTEEGQIADQVVQTPFGWHVIKLDSRIVPTKEQQLQQARSDAFDQWIAQKRTEIGVNRFPPQTPTATAAPTAPADAVPLPTAPLGGVPTVVSDTTTLEPPVAETPTAETPTVEATTATTATSVPARTVTATP
ncbi:MAG: peptidylprolyl isomerase [Roseiflexaceae bacterium]|nr:peptidylprolyl isomerase [Roseiflexaceae bacterium]